MALSGGCLTDSFAAHVDLVGRPTRWLIRGAGSTWNIWCCLELHFYSVLVDDHLLTLELCIAWLSHRVFFSTSPLMMRCYLFVIYCSFPRIDLSDMLPSSGLHSRGCGGAARNSWGHRLRTRSVWLLWRSSVFAFGSGRYFLVGSEDYIMV